MPSLVFSPVLGLLTQVWTQSGGAHPPGGGWLLSFCTFLGLDLFAFAHLKKFKVESLHATQRPSGASGLSLVLVTTLF